MINGKRQEELNIHNHYILASEEPCLIERAINDIKKLIGVDESFDADSFSIQDYEYPEIINRIYSPPFVSSRRLIILKDIQDESIARLKEFARMLGNVPSTVCLIMVYEIDKRKIQSRVKENYEKLIELFPRAHARLLVSDPVLTQREIVERLKRLGLGEQPDIVEYLREEFKNDITGMENEFQKIENYVFQAKQLGIADVKDISRGLTDYDAYTVARSFMQRRVDTIELFVALKPYIKTPLVVIDAIARMLRNSAMKFFDRSFSRLASELLQIDSKLKSGSDFADILVEIFFVKNLSVTGKGVAYGKQFGKT